MKSSLISGVALSALMALSLGAAARAQDVAQDPAPVGDAPMAQMSPTQIQEQITQLQQDLDNVKQVQAETSGALKGTSINYDPSPRFTDSSGNVFKVRGRALFDAVQVNADRHGTYGLPIAAGTTAPFVPGYNSRNIRGRQVFLGVEGNIGSKFAYKIEGGAVNGGAWAWDDAILEYKVFPDTSIIFGNQKTISLEDITSTRFTTFMDRGPYNTLLDLSYKLGIAVVKVGPNYSIGAAVLGNSLNSADVTSDAYPNGTNANERVQFNIRGTYALINSDTQKLHLGGWLRYRNRGGEATGFNYAGNINSSYNPTPTINANAQAGGAANVVNLPLVVQTGAVGDDDFTIGVEGMYLNKNFSVQGEFANVHVNRLTTQKNAVLGGPDFDFQTGYAFVSYFLTGEQRNYNVRGEIGRTTVLRPIDNGGIGAIELAARVDYADLSDMEPNTVSLLPAQYGGASTAGISTAGEYKSLTLGLNWYPISYVRFMANYSFADIDNRSFGVLGPTSRINKDATVNVFQLRAQVDY